jgi:diguanylate cyclase (GGDEF)-like protein/PAS domain S-box-containing protein
MSVLNIVSATASAELQREDREIELRESELRYRTTYDNVPVIICTVDDSHTITDLNNAWVATTGFTVDESVGSKLYSYLTEASRTRFLDVASSRANGSNPSDVVLDFVCKSGDQLKLAYSATRTSAADGAPVYITVLEDITSHQIAEQQLRLAATAFETHEALVIRDAERRILRVNEAFKRITGYSDLDVLGETSTILVAGPSADVDEREIWTVVDETSEWDGERISYRADGSTFAAWYTISAVRADDGTITHYVENFADISELKQAHAEAERLALYDPLTELPNRRYLIEKLGSEIARARRHSSTGALLFIDLDQFKTINDSLGHTVGDELLIQVARRLKRLLRQEDSIARLGGDEFVVVLPELGDETEQCINQARRVADKIHFELGKNYELGNHQVHVTPTIGVTLFPEGGKTVEEILQEADSAMYRGKADGRNATKFFHPSMQSDAQQRLSLERDLRTAAERDELALYFQPQYDADYKMFAAEALLRWNHPERGFVSPAHFIPIAEESGLILEISRWVFTRALECLRRWDRDGFVHVDHLAINVSSRQFSSSTFVQDVMRDLVAMSVPANRVVLEVTEGTVIKNFDATARKMEQLRDIGIRFSVDDFGIGYSSLSYLSRLPLDQLKIDQSFVIDVLEDPNDKVIAETIIGMGRNLNLQTIAEGVETTAQLEFLRSLGCDGFQGFLLSKPVPESDFLLLDKTWTGPANKRSH